MCADGHRGSSKKRVKRLDFSYLAGRVMHFYGMSYTDMRALPLSVFWELSMNVDRISAEQDRRMAVCLGQVISGAFGGKGFSEYLSSLEQLQGLEVDNHDDEIFDRRGFERLRGLFGGARCPST